MLSHIITESFILVKNLIRQHNSINTLNLIQLMMVKSLICKTSIDTLSFHRYMRNKYKPITTQAPEQGIISRNFWARWLFYFWILICARQILDSWQSTSLIIPHLENTSTICNVTPRLVMQKEKNDTKDETVTIDLLPQQWHHLATQSHKHVYWLLTQTKNQEVY